MLKDIKVPSSSSSNYLTLFNGELFFMANDGVNGNELWHTDGTEGGTTLFKDLNPGSSSSSPSSLRVVNVGGASRLYFAANDGVNTKEVFASDGTVSGTGLVADIWTAASYDTGIGPNSFTSFNGKVYFAGNNGVDGKELFVSDGTQGGTYMLVDLKTGTCPMGMGYVAACAGDPRDLTVFNGKLYLTADSNSNGTELWQCS
jgi:ELWxxDGT repeat protein